jgi:AraC-like DNA-binding protein
MAMGCRAKDPSTPSLARYAYYRQRANADVQFLSATLAVGNKYAETLRDLRQVIKERPPQTIAEAARELIKLRLADSVVDIDGAAKLLGIGTRKLQRQLAHENFTYRELLEQTRMGRALDLICESSQPITSIALSLGYSDIASFTRAFQRWTGFPPSHPPESTERRDQLRVRLWH